LAEGILKRQAKEAGVDLVVDSAGTGHWHVGDSPDRRAIHVGRRRGCDMSMKARQVRSRDFTDFDLIVAMDSTNLEDLRAWKGSDHEKLHLATEFDPSQSHLDVPDPYYGTVGEFEEVAEMLEPICRGILMTLEMTSSKRAEA
jgi:protein-tyrosine phosphatase